MADQWFYARNGQQAGPVSFEQLREVVRRGELGATDLVWQEGMPDWQPAGQIPGLLGQAPAYGMPPQAPPPSGPVPAQPIGYAGGYPPQQQAYPPGSVPTYLAQSIIVTILCCWPFGIPAIVYAAQVNGKLATGDYQGAVNASNNAKMWSWIAFGLGFGVVILYILAAVAGNM